MDRREAADTLRREGVRPDLVDLDVLLAHRPDRDLSRTVRSSRGIEDRVRPLVGGIDTAMEVPDRTLDVPRFVTTVTGLLDTQVAGYAFELRRGGVRQFARQGGWARLDGDPSPLRWGYDERMHVASCSKLVTAMAMARVLAGAGISPDARISPYLPEYWVLGPGVGDITFADLLTHRSGFVTDSSSDYLYMKGKVAAGVPDHGAFSYANMNFGLCRILVATITGDIAPSARFVVPGNDLSDQFWDAICIGSYRSHVEASVFTPSGVSGPTLDHTDSMALGYRRPATVPGWNSQDLSPMSGGAAWHMSAADLLDVMSQYRRGGGIVPPDAATANLDRGFGVDEVIDTRAGRVYDKNGYWSLGDGRTEQASVWFLPEDLEVAVLANSPYGGGTIPELRDAVTQAYLDCLVPTWNPLRGVLLLGGFRTQSELVAMSHEDMRNTLIVELSGRTVQKDYQSYDDDRLAGAGAVLVAMRRARIRDDATLATMTSDDMRNTLIVELDAQTRAGGRLQGFTDLQLAGIALGDDLAWRGVDLTSVPNWTRGVLLVGGFRTQHELNAMTDDDMRNTLIVELTKHSNQSDYQAYDDTDLAGAGAVMVALRELGARTDAELRAMSSDDQRNTLIVELDAQVGMGRALQGLSNLRLVRLLLGI